MFNFRGLERQPPPPPPVYEEHATSVALIIFSLTLLQFYTSQLLEWVDHNEGPEPCFPKSQLAEVATPSGKVLRESRGWGVQTDLAKD